MIRFYILQGHEPVRVQSVEEWGLWFSGAGEQRKVEQTEFPGDVRVSTVFIGVDHNLGGGPPMIFESMIFGGPHDDEMDRCSTWDEAILMHRRLCVLARMGLVQPSM